MENRERKVIKLSEVRKQCDLSQLTGEQFLKELVIAADNEDESAEYHTFLAALKALKTVSLNTKLTMAVSLDNSEATLKFNFKFE